MTIDQNLILLQRCWLACAWLTNSLDGAQEVQQQANHQVMSSGVVAPSELRTLDGQVIVVPPREDFAVGCFLGIECGLAKLNSPRINRFAKNRFAKEYPSKDLQFVAINRNRQDSTAEWRQFAVSNQLAMLLVKGHDNLIANVLSVVRNPDAVVVHSAGEIRYCGRIDDQYEVEPAGGGIDRFAQRERSA